MLTRNIQMQTNVPRIYPCALYNETFNSENELDKHMDIDEH